MPRSLTVVGAGVIGIEYATIFSALDVPVTLIEPREHFLEFIDREIIDEFVHDLRKRGIQLRLGRQGRAGRARRAGLCRQLSCRDGRRCAPRCCSMRRAASARPTDLKLEACGLEADDRGRLKVDPKTFQTTVPHIYAAGDVIGFPSLASTSMEQGRIAACHAFGAPMPPAPEYFPYGIYAVPEISTVGLTEEQAREKGIAYEVGIARFRETSRGHIMGLESGMMKMIFSLDDRKLLGVHILGEGATELIHIGQAVLNLGGTRRLFRRERLQLSDARRGLQDRGARRVQPHGAAVVRARFSRCRVAAPKRVCAEGRQKCLVSQHFLGREPRSERAWAHHASSRSSPRWR